MIYVQIGRFVDDTSMVKGIHKRIQNENCLVIFNKYAKFNRGKMQTSSVILKKNHTKMVRRDLVSGSNEKKL